jgi:Leucine-rich repeat (LRR) protein
MLLNTPEHLFDGLVSLQTLDLTKNRLTCVPQEVRLCTGMRHLSLRGNHITSLPDRSFNTLVALETLDLSENQLPSTPERLFDGLLSLRALDLANNRLTSLPEGVFRDLSALQMLYLGDSSSHSLPHRLNRLIHGTGWRMYDHHPSGNAFVFFPRGLFDGLNRLQTLALPTNPELMICLDGLTSPSLEGGYARIEVNGVTFEHRLHPNHIPFLGMMRTFYSYACESPLARVYQLVADNHSREDIQNAFIQLPEAMRNALFGWVWVEAGAPCF